MFENAQRMHANYGHLFTSTLKLDSSSSSQQWFKRLRELIDEQQSKPVWITAHDDHIDDSDMTAPLQQQQQQQKQQVQQQHFDEQHFAQPQAYNYCSQTAAAAANYACNLAAKHAGLVGDDTDD